MKPALFMRDIHVWQYPAAINCHTVSKDSNPKLQCQKKSHDIQKWHISQCQGLIACKLRGKFNGSDLSQKNKYMIKKTSKPKKHYS